MITDITISTPRLRRLRLIALIIGVIGIGLAVLGYLTDPKAFFQSYLLAWILWLGVTLGSTGVVMMHHLMGGRWGMIVRRLGEHAGMTLPLLIVLFVPIALGMHWLYIWSRPGEALKDPVIAHKEPYLNVEFFLIRAGIYFVIWLWMAWFLRQRSLHYGRSGNWNQVRAMHSVSAGGQVVYFATMSFASVDWLMSLEPHWFSTVFGFIVIAGQGIAGLSFLIICLAILVARQAEHDEELQDSFNDLGNIMLTFIVFWTYLCFCQLLVIWMANKQDEIPWYVQRLNNGWMWIGLVLVLLHFILPFIVLLMRGLKRKVPAMLGLCIGLLVMRAVDDFWMIGPSGEASYPKLSDVISWMDFVFPVGMGGLWLAMFLWLVEGHPLEVRTEESLDAQLQQAPQV